MEAIWEFFDPSSGLGSWMLRIIGLYVISYFIVWILALGLSRLSWFGQNDVYIKVYLGWLISFTLHSILSATFLILMAYHYKQFDISWVYCLPFIILVLISGVCGLNMSGNIRDRL